MGDDEQAGIPATATPDGSPAAAQGAGETPTATGNGAVVVSGQFPAGTVVKCYHVDSEATLRVDADATLVGERMSDDNGDVGFPGLEQGARYFVCGYVDGTLLEIRCVGQDPEAPNAPLGQPPVQPLPTTVGTQQEKVEPVPPAPPAEEIPVGIAPEAQPAAPAEPAADGPRLFLHTADEPIDAEVWTLAPVRVVDDNRPDGLAPLYTYTGADTALPDGWAVYSGPTEPAPDAGTPDASESSGTGKANGGAIEQAPAVEQVPAPDGTTTADGSPAAPAENEVTFHSGLTAPDGSPVADAAAAPADVAPPAAPLDPSAQPAPAASDTPSPDASAPEVDQPAADPAAAPAAAADPAPDAPASS